MNGLPHYYGVSEELMKLKKLSKDDTIKVSDVLTILEMFFEALEKQRIRIETRGMGMHFQEKLRFVAGQVLGMRAQSRRRLRCRN